MRILALALLSVFMALPAQAERKFVDGAKFCGTAPTEGYPDGYEWEALVNSAWTTIGESSSPCFFFSQPMGVKIILRMWPVTHKDLDNTNGGNDLYNERGPFVSDPSIRFTTLPNFDYDNNGVVGATDYGILLSRPSTSVQLYGMFLQVFGYRIRDKEYFIQ